MGGEILFNQKATRIITDKNSIKSVIVKNKESEKEYTADYFFSTMPVKDLISSLDQKDGNIEKISNGLGYRSFITIGLLVNKLEIVNNT